MSSIHITISNKPSGWTCWKCGKHYDGRANICICDLKEVRPVQHSVRIPSQQWIEALRKYRSKKP